MPKARVYELAKELSLDSKRVLAILADLGEFIRSASSTVEAPTVRRLRSELARRSRGARAGLHPESSSGRQPHVPSRVPRRLGSDAAPTLTLLEEAETLRPRRRNGPGTERDTRLRWAERLFEPADVREWRAAGLGPSDDSLAERCRDAGLVPEDLSRVVDGLRVVQRVTGGESAVSVRSRLPDQAGRASDD